MYTTEAVSDTNEVIFLLKKIESIIDPRLIEEVEPRDDETQLVEEYLKRKSEGNLELH